MGSILFIFFYLKTKPQTFNWSRQFMLRYLSNVFGPLILVDNENEWNKTSHKYRNINCQLQL